jgi:hypothetical protein
LRWETVELSKTGLGSRKNSINYNAVSLRFEGLIPGDKLYVKVEDKNGSYDLDVIIGVTGSYIIDLDAGVTVSAVKFIDSPTDNVNVDAGRV